MEFAGLFDEAFSEIGMTSDATRYGSLWRVRESAWLEAMNRSNLSYNSDSNRTWHPGISMREVEPDSLEWIPTLLGRTRETRQAIAICHFEGPESDRKTYFGSIGPVSLATSLFGRSTSKDFKNEEFWFRDYPIVLNTPKPLATSKERRHLRRWWGRRFSSRS